MERNYQVTISYGDGSTEIVDYCLPEDVLEEIEKEVEYDAFHRRGSDSHRMLMNIERYRI